MEKNIEIEESSGRKNKGFTLIELLIVIVILGILAAVTVFAVRGISDKGNTAACSSDKKTLETAAEAFFANTGAYPANQAAMVTGGLLRSASTKYTYATVGTPVTDYTLTGVSPCT